MADKVVKRPQISVGLKPNSKEVVLKHYLVSQKGVSEKDLVMKALLAFYLPAASIQDRTIERTHITKSVIDSCWLLLDQLFEINRSIDDRDLAAKAVVQSFVRSMIPALYQEFEIIDGDRFPAAVSLRESTSHSASFSSIEDDDDDGDDANDDDDEYEYEQPLSSGGIELSAALLARLEK